jgi:hypothetical protein
MMMTNAKPTESPTMNSTKKAQDTQTAVACGAQRMDDRRLRQAP